MRDRCRKTETHDTEIQIQAQSRIKQGSRGRGRKMDTQMGTQNPDSRGNKKERQGVTPKEGKKRAPEEAAKSSLREGKTLPQGCTAWTWHAMLVCLTPETMFSSLPYVAL